MTSRRASRAGRVSRYGAAFLAAGVAVAMAVPASGSARASGGAYWPQFHFNAARSCVLKSRAAASEITRLVLPTSVISCSGPSTGASTANTSR